MSTETNKHLATVILSSVETVKETGGAVEIYGVRIEPCNEYGQTETTRRADEAREALARVEALAEWHETKADKARRFRPEVDGENLVMDKAAQVHDDAARRLRAALRGDQ